jgi:activator of 2-hydroxyglutaryl-CoA dehydratase
MLRIVGIDIGSVALSVVVVNEKGAMINSFYQFHSGAISDTLRSILNNIDIRRVSGIAMTLSGPEIFSNVSRYDTQIAMIAAVKKYHAEVGRSLFD